MIVGQRGCRGAESWRKIHANVRALAEIGAFLVHNRHHRVDALGDLSDDGGCEINVNGYREMLPMEIDFS